MYGKKKRSIQRWWCNDCQRAFTPVSSQVLRYKYDLAVAFEALDLYYDVKGSYRAVARQLSKRCKTEISPERAFYLVNSLGASCKTTIEVARELRPPWSGWLGIDGNYIKVAGEDWIWMLAVDLKSQDLVHEKLIPRELFRYLLTFLLELKRQVRYPLKGLVIDKPPGMVGAVERMFPGIPFQACVIHIERRLNWVLPKYKSHSPVIQEFKEIARRILYASSLDMAQKEYQRLQQFKRLHSQEISFNRGFKSALVTMERNFDWTLTHFDYPELPRDTNIIEGVINRLDDKLTPIRGFQSLPTAKNSLKLLTMWYRFKSFTDSRINAHNGKCPLQLAGVNTSKLNWKQYSQRTKSQH